MKRLKFVLPFVAFIIAFGASFATKSPLHKVKTMAVLWQYNQNATDPKDPANYTLLSSIAEPTPCGGFNVVCEISAESDNQSTPHPVFNSGDDPAGKDQDLYQSTFRAQ